MSYFKVETEKFQQDADKLEERRKNVTEICQYVEMQEKQLQDNSNDLLKEKKITAESEELASLARK